MFDSLDAFVLAFLLSGLIFPFHVIFLRLEGEKSKRVLAIFKSMFLIIIVWYFLLKMWRGQGSIVLSDYFSGLFTILFVTFGYMEFYSMIVRGFSLNVIVSVYKNQKLSKEGINKEYAGGKGLDFIKEKRVSDLVNLEFVKEENNHLVLVKPKGQWAGIIGGTYKRVFNIVGGGL